MCAYKTLQNNEHGYVMMCNSCRHFHVAFGNTVLAFNEEQLSEFIETVEESYEAHQYHEARDIKLVQLHTAARSVMLVFSLNEMVHLKKLLLDARNNLKREKLFMFNNN